MNEFKQLVSTEQFQANNPLQKGVLTRRIGLALVCLGALALSGSAVNADSQSGFAGADASAPAIVPPADWASGSTGAADPPVTKTCEEICEAANEAGIERCIKKFGPNGSNPSPAGLAACLAAKEIILIDCLDACDPPTPPLPPVPVPDDAPKG